eukprot:CAMPEP_0113540866 /NCGR_PEP_ID=MMETSP0015_2-20120614/8713_1 /TAXON_ID=2838 /ORGANISM="Odontella" /LENGTH=204 /DNA_ID=CAMNT_0000440707 /DNA_START=96 /DNA_END=710 /DNA_ORIENTATION=- /assembly_acc=CAM_ASM_000160
MTAEEAAAAEGSDDDVPELEEATPEAVAEGEGAAEGEAAAAAGAGKSQNRSEKKSRKMMARLGMRPLPGIARVTLKTAGRGGYFAIDEPDVYVSSGSNPTYVVFGEARQGGGMGGGAAAAAAQQQMRQAKAAQEAAAPKAEGEAVAEVPAVSDEGGEEAVDETGVEAKDIELVMSQASCSRAKAVAALKENDGDLVNAIMSLTT